MRSRLLLGLSGAVALAAGAIPVAGCLTPPVRLQPEDKSRRAAPLPACVLHLPPRRTQSLGTVRKLKEEQIWHLVYPGFDEQTRAIPAGATVCTGRDGLGLPAYKDGAPLHGLVAEEGDVLYGTGGDRMKVVWLRSHKFHDGSVGGALALVRGTERFGELFAVGNLRGKGDDVRLGTERMGAEILVATEDSGCANRKPGQACESTLNLFLPRRGELVHAADVSVERVAYFPKGERGAQGNLEYHLTSVTKFKEGGIVVTEQIKVADEVGRVLRNAERERVYRLDEARMVSEDESLWQSVMKARETR